MDYVVEPWFLGGGADSPAGQDFKGWQEATELKYGTTFASSLAELPPPAAPRLALISGRTADNPRLLTECIANNDIDADRFSARLQQSNRLRVAIFSNEKLVSFPFR